MALRSWSDAPADLWGIIERLSISTSIPRGGWADAPADLWRIIERLSISSSIPRGGWADAPADLWRIIERLSISSSNPRGGWADAPPDVLWLIIARLPTADYIRFAAVCVSWRSVLSERRHPPAPQIPFLLLSHHDSTLHFLSLPDNKRHRVHLPGMGITYRFIGSSGGWIITTVNDSSPLLLVNPFSPSTHLRLPSVTTLRPVAANTTLLCNTGLTHREDMPRDYFRKLVISSTPPATAAVITKGSQRLGFARVGGDCWMIRYNNNSLDVSDILFIKDTLYAVYFSGWLMSVNLTYIAHPTITLKMPPPCGMGMYTHSHNYLVMSSRGELLQVLRWMHYRGLCLTTWLVRVFKMVDARVVADRSWIEMEGLGNDALFLGHGSHGQSFTLSAEDFPEVRRNCVYFMDNYQMYENGDSKCDMGVYNMEDKSFEPYYPCEYQTSRLPVWFSPIAAAAPQQQ